MATAKTQPTDASVADYLATIEDPQRRKDCEQLVALMQRVSGHAPQMWGTSIVGFGRYHYRYDSGHEGDACQAGLSCRKSEITLYLMSGFERHDELLARLGKHKSGKACLYVKRVADIDLAVLETLVAESIAEVKRRYP